MPSAPFWPSAVVAATPEEPPPGCMAFELLPTVIGVPGVLKAPPPAEAI